MSVHSELNQHHRPSLNHPQAEAMLNQLKSIISSNADLDPLIEVEEIALTTQLQQDMGFDSLALMSLLYELQESQFPIEEAQMEQWSLIADIVDSMLKSKQI